MKDQNTRRVFDWGHLFLLLVIVGIVVAYLLDARATSLKTNNLLLVQPASIFAIVLAALIVPQLFRRVAPDDNTDPQVRRTALLELFRVGVMAATFGIFVFSLETIGFDIATFAFTAVGLYICGERRLWVIGVYSAAFTAAIIYGYQLLVPYPFPLTIL